jgi:hypothetical protein
MVFISPWLLLYLPYYILALTVGRGQTLIPLIAGGYVTVHPLSLLSPAEIFYGGSRLAYTCVALALFACAVHAMVRARREPSIGRARLDLASAALAAAGTYFFWVLVGPHLQETDTALRYSVPVLIGATSAALSLSAIGSERGSKMLSGVLAAALVLLFAPAMRQRMGLLLHQGTELSYMRNWDLRAIDGARHFQVPFFDGETAAEVRSLQDLVPAGESLLVWTNTLSSSTITATRSSMPTSPVLAKHGDGYRPLTTCCGNTATYRLQRTIGVRCGSVADRGN